MNYEKEYIRLWNAAEQAMENLDFDKRFVASWAALRVLKNAVNWGKQQPPCRTEKKDTDKHKLISLLRGLQCRNIEELAEKDAAFLFVFGRTMADEIKLLKKREQIKAK